MDSVPVIVLSGLTDEQKKGTAWQIIAYRWMLAGMKIYCDGAVGPNQCWFWCLPDRLRPTEIDELLTDVLPGTGNKEERIRRKLIRLFMSRRAVNRISWTVRRYENSGADQPDTFGVPDPDIEKFLLCAAERHTVFNSAELRTITLMPPLKFSAFSRVGAGDHWLSAGYWKWICPNEQRMVAIMHSGEEEYAWWFLPFILTHGRPDKVLTYRTLRRLAIPGKFLSLLMMKIRHGIRHGWIWWTGAGIFQSRYCQSFDEADNFGDRRSIFYARNACSTWQNWSGVNTSFSSMMIITVPVSGGSQLWPGLFPDKETDAILSEMLAYYESIPALSIACRRAGIFLVTMAAMLRGWNAGNEQLYLFGWSTVLIHGAHYEDVNTYTNLGRCGELFMTIVLSS